METLKLGGLTPSVTTLRSSPNQKPVTSLRVVRMLTTSEIEFLRQDMKRANDILDRLLRTTLK